jgi:hypothetical protein
MRNFIQTPVVDLTERAQPADELYNATRPFSFFDDVIPANVRCRWSETNRLWRAGLLLAARLISGNVWALRSVFEQGDWTALPVAFATWIISVGFITANDWYWFLSCVELHCRGTLDDHSMLIMICGVPAALLSRFRRAIS